MGGGVAVEMNRRVRGLRSLEAGGGVKRVDR